MLYIRQGATHKVVLGPAVAVGDGFTPVTTLAISTADEAEAILHDNGTVVDISAYTFAAITTADGYYHLTLQSGISGTVGHLTIVINDDSLILPLRADFCVLEEAVYDALFAAAAPGYGTAQTGDSFARLGAPAGASVSADVLAVKNDTAAILLDTNELQTDWANGGRLDLIIDAILVDTGTTLQAELDGIQADTEDIQTRIGSPAVSLTADIAALNDLSAAEVNAEVDTALAEIHLDHLLAVDYDPAAKPGVATALLNELIESDVGVSRFTANALEQAPTGGSAPTVEQIRAEIDANSTQLAAAKLNTDYPEDFTHISTAGSAGTTVGINGTARNPVTTVADARTIAIARNRLALKGGPGESFTVSTGTLANYRIDLNSGSWTIDPTVSLSGTTIYSSGKRANLYGPVLGQVTVATSTVLQNLYVTGIILTSPGLRMIDCGVGGDVTDSTGGPNAGERPTLVECYNVKGNGSAVTFNLLSGGHWSLQGWYGDLQITNMGAGQQFYCNGWGKLTIAASCTGGTIKHTSHIEIEDLSGGAVTTELISEPGDVSGLTAAAQGDVRAAVGLAVANLDTQIGDIDTNLATVLSRIGSPAVSLTADIAALNDISAADVWAAATRTLTAGTNIVLAKGTGITGFNDLSAAAVNAEVVDALAADTYALPGQVTPSATPTLAAAIMQCFQLATNKADQTAALQQVYNRAGDTVHQKRTVSAAAGTVTLGPLIAGP